MFKIWYGKDSEGYDYFTVNNGEVSHTYLVESHEVAKAEAIKVAAAHEYRGETVQLWEVK